MTELLYYKDAYLKECEAAVTEVRDNGIILDKTIFYPECGGQPGDKGSFGEYAIKDTIKLEDGTPLHVIDGEKPEVGTRLSLKLDWNHRYKYMKEHSAQHLLSATLFHEFGISTVAVHQGETILTIETDKSEIDDEVLLRVEDSANNHVREGLRIYQEEVDHKAAENLHMRRSIKVEGRVKLVFIEGLDVVACGGVHIANSKEIGEIHYAGKETIRGHVRTIWNVSREAVEERRENERALKNAYRLLSTSRDELGSAISHLLDENYQLKHKEKALEAKLAEKELVSNGENPIIFSTDVSLDAFMPLLKEGTEAFIVNVSDNTFLYYGEKSRFLLLKEKLNLRGGGKSVMFRGSFSGDDILNKAEGILK